VQKESKSHAGRMYYFNTATGETSWEPPTAASSSAGTEVRALHILVKHSGSRRPSSWRQEKITISKAEALQKLNGIKAQLVAAPNLRQKFEEIARVESDCSSAKAGGDLGAFGRGQMQKPFEDAAFGLKEGEMCGPVDTESGVHLIMRVPLN